MEKYPITFTYVPEDKYIPDYVIVEESYNTRQEYLSLIHISEPTRPY